MGMNDAMRIDSRQARGLSQHSTDQLAALGTPMVPSKPRTRSWNDNEA
jgi:hypothetical protein